nr:tetratricopeptide repeat-containing serine protease family protein [Nocardia bovistercoris]
MIAPTLVLTSAHVVPETGGAVTVTQPARTTTYTAVVVWRGTPDGKDDAALVQVTDPAWPVLPIEPIVWGRTVTYQPGIPCRSWGFPDFVQRRHQPVDMEQPRGTLNPGDRYSTDTYVLHLDTHPPTTMPDGGSPWAGMSGAAVFCGALLTGVVAVDPAHRDHAALEAVPAYVLLTNPDFRTAVEDNAGEGWLRCEPVELQELMDRQSPLHMTTTIATPASLLTARRAVVPFHGRTDLLRKLHTWATEPGLGVWLLYGRGGQGKTRLAHYFGEILTTSGWAVVWLDPAATDQLRVLAQVRVPLLVVIDYAETRPDQLRALLTHLSRLRTDRVVKVLLLARTIDSWWPQLATGTTDTVTDILDTTHLHELTALDASSEERHDSYRSAVRAFGQALPGLRHTGLPDPTAAVETLTAAVPAGLEADTTVLGVQMRALVDLLDTTNRTPNAGGGLERRVLVHERSYWRRTAQARGLTPQWPLETLTDAVAATAVLAPTTPTDIENCVRRIPEFTDQAQITITMLRDWLMSLYPGQHPGVFAGLAPDRLAEHLIGDLLTDTSRPTVIDALAPTTSEGEAEHLLTVCTRATTHPDLPEVGDRLTRLCLDHPDTLLFPALRVATQVETPTPLLNALDQIATHPTTSTDTLKSLHDRIPTSTLVLARTAVTIARAIADHHRTTDDLTESDQAQLAQAVNNLAIRLGAVGRPEEALRAATEAVDLYRTLATTNPDAHLPNLAMSVNNLAADLADAGQHEEALRAATEAVDLYRILATTNPDAHLPNLAGSVNNLAVRLADAGQHEEALRAATEAVDLYRTLTTTNPDAHLPNLAGSVNNLANRLADAGQHEEALRAATAAADIRRRLATTNPDAHLPDLAMSVNNLAVRLATAGQHEEALRAATEAVDLYRTLATTNPDAHLPNLATSMNNLAADLADAGQHEEALRAATEAVDILTKFARSEPAAFGEALERAQQVQTLLAQQVTPQLPAVRERAEGRFSWLRRRG